MRCLPAFAVFALGCNPAREVGPWTLTPTEAGFDIARSDGSTFVGSVAIDLGVGDSTVEFQTGSYKFDDAETVWTSVSPAGRPAGDDPAWTWTLETEAGVALGLVTLAELTDGILAVVVAATEGDTNRIRYSVPCTGDDHFAGLGQHAQDVDHVGESFALWVSEPGIGKSDSETPTDDWFLTGTKHASSYPDPFFIKPDPLGVEVVTNSRVEVDLCTTDAWSASVWNNEAQILFYDVESPLAAVQRHALRTGTPAIPPDWAFAPWNDAVGGEARVREVADALRSSGASSGVIWTEDWKGAEQTAYGYHLLPSWEVDETLYPDAGGIASDLAGMGFAWFAYFQPFVVADTPSWEEASEFVIRDTEGEPYTFTGVTFDPTSVLDLTRDDARAWAQEKMQAVVDIGFTGWMADYAEWLPTDASISQGNALDDHNAYPLWWQETNADIDAVMFTRSGWTGSPALSPIGWGGDQRTSFDADDGFPSVIPMGLGASISGVAVFTHDIGGYQSIGNDPSTKELWWRWCTLGALTPIMRTHHGAFKDDNWQFDSDEETLAHYARWSQIHGQLSPYLLGLAARSQSEGTPMLLPPFLRYPSEDWARIDAWLLGDLLVAPVMTEGATSRDVALPAGPTWYDFWTGEVATSGAYDAPVDSIPVFAPAGAIIPMYATAPETMQEGPLEGVVTRSDVDGERIVTIFASGGGAISSTFVEADGTVYTVTGTATGPGEGQLDGGGAAVVGGLTVTVSGADRVYGIVVR